MGERVAEERKRDTVRSSEPARTARHRAPSTRPAQHAAVAAAERAADEVRSGQGSTVRRSLADGRPQIRRSVWSDVKGWASAQKGRAKKAWNKRFGGKPMQIGAPEPYQGRYLLKQQQARETKGQGSGPAFDSAPLPLSRPRELDTSVGQADPFDSRNWSGPQMTPEERQGPYEAPAPWRPPQKDEALEKTMGLRKRMGPLVERVQPFSWQDIPLGEDLKNGESLKDEKGRLKLVNHRGNQRQVRQRTDEEVNADKVYAMARSFYNDESEGEQGSEGGYIGAMDSVEEDHLPDTDQQVGMALDNNQQVQNKQQYGSDWRYLMNRRRR